MSEGYGVTPDELTAVSQTFAGQCPAVAAQARSLRDSMVDGTNTGELFRAEGEAYADLLATAARCVSDYAAHLDSIAAGLAADASGYAAAEAGNTAAFRGDG